MNMSSVTADLKNIDYQNFHKANGNLFNPAISSNIRTFLKRLDERVGLNKITQIWSFVQGENFQYAQPNIEGNLQGLMRSSIELYQLNNAVIGTTGAALTGNGSIGGLQDKRAFNSTKSLGAPLTFGVISSFESQRGEVWGTDGSVPMFIGIGGGDREGIYLSSQYITGAVPQPFFGLATYGPPYLFAPYIDYSTASGNLNIPIWNDPLLAGPQGTTCRVSTGPNNTNSTLTTGYNFMIGSTTTGLQARQNAVVNGACMTGLGTGAHLIQPPQGQVHFGLGSFGYGAFCGRVMFGFVSSGYAMNTGEMMLVYNTYKETLGTGLNLL